MSLITYTGTALAPRFEELLTSIQTNSINSHHFYDKMTEFRALLKTEQVTLTIQYSLVTTHNTEHFLEEYKCSFILI